ncbi:restriction endonuclease-like protein [Acetatifactor muris]|uniref:restriction endonuclease-like protein n=1 Tax=Acetatifactor muris TaxID=879566 RepID=UPI0023F153CD|nr:restriction endonuclease-like protein [Acetatifactor muris]
MDLLPTGSDKVLEIHTSEVNIVIKAKKVWSGAYLEQSSSLVVAGFHLKKIHIPAVEAHGEYLESESAGDDKDGAEYAQYEITVSPLFFEQTDYEIIIKSVSGGRVSFWNENYRIREKVGPVIDGDESLLSGVINFGNMVGYSDFEIYLEDRKHVTIRVEVFPTKISYKEDYQMMTDDISEMACEVLIDFMQKTYQMFSQGEKQTTVLAVYFRILSTVFVHYMNAVNRILSEPYHRLITEHEVVPEHKAGKTDRASERWLMRHQKYVAYSSGEINAERVLAVKKRITYDTAENRFVKFILHSTIRKLEEFVKRYGRSVKQTEEKVLADADRMMKEVRRVLNTAFLREVSEYSAAQSMSLVFGMAPGYRELYKYWLMLQRSLSVNGDVFKMSPKDTAQLYEYWCFIKLFSLLKKEYRLLSPDIIRVDNSGITVTLVKGTRSTAKFINPATGEVIKLTYNPGESKTRTVNQKPDNVLELEKNGTQVSYKYVFDAKYRIETNPESTFYPDTKPGPKVDDINTMHRYRDSIVYENPRSRFIFEKTMFGAYILFPLEGKYEEEYREHRFYKSIDTVNIGGLPFLPGATKLVQKLLRELISDSGESAFERTSLPRGIEERLAAVDWDKRDVLIGTFRSAEQFQICFEKNFYYVPAKQIHESRFPIHYVALYQTNKMFGEGKGQIRYYGEVLRVEPVRRADIKEVPVVRKNGDEPYYKISVRQWKDITEINESKKPILPKESGFVVDFTNLFLLEHSEWVQELRFKSEAEYRFYTELKRSAKAAEIAEDETAGFVMGHSRFVFSDGEILALKDGKIVERKLLTEFSRRPAQVYRQLQSAVQD